MAYLAAWQATGDSFYLDAAREAGEALLHGQLESGGWRNSIDFDATGPRADRYRNGKGRTGGKNYSTLDDGITQSALRMLILLDEALEFRSAEVNEGVTFGLQALIKAQFPNGAFPQVWQGPVSRDHPETRAKFPDYDWRTENRVKDYWNLYTLNDNLARDVAETLIEAHRVYADPVYGKSLRKLGDFLLLARMPEPQPAWAQQYHYTMEPAWARKFEPPAIAGTESRGVMQTLVLIAASTGERKYLEPVIPAIEYFERSRLPDGQYARFYELRTNRPLYMKRKGKIYSITHDDSNLPGHYGWKARYRFDPVRAACERVAAGDKLPVQAPPSAARIREILESLDKQGRWISVAKKGERLVGQARFAEGERYLSSEVFSNHLSDLSRNLGVRRGD